MPAGYASVVPIAVRTFSADQVRKACLVVEGLVFADPEDPTRKVRTLNLLEFYEKTAPPEVASSPTKVSVESGVAEQPESPHHSGKTTSEG